MFDVIKEPKTMEKKSFAIPEGCKVLNVSEESGRLVIEFEPVAKFEPKKGDILAWSTELESGIFIFKEITSNYHYHYASRNNNTSKLYLDNSIGAKLPMTIRSATPAETAQLFASLEKEGLKWNAETMEVERLRWKPKDNEAYYYLNSYLEPTLVRWDNSGIDLGRWSVGNCHKNKETCTVSSTKCKALLLSL